MINIKLIILIYENVFMLHFASIIIFECPKFSISLLELDI